jgi:DNA-binding NarL/FixJ family response regulator
MAAMNFPLSPHKSGPDFPARSNPGLSLFPLSVWPNLGMALRLSRREMQIVQGVFQDRKEESIASELGISPHTVNTYFQRLYNKLRVCSRPQLIVRVMAEYLAMTPGTSSAQVSDEDPTRRNAQAGAS